MTHEGRNEGKSDLFSFRQWIYTLSGCGVSTTTAYIAYIVFVYAVQSYQLVMTVVAMYISFPNRVLTALAVYMTMSTFYTLGLLVSRHALDRTLRETNKMILSGIYNYEEEEIEEELIDMKVQIERQIQKLSKIMNILFTSGAVSNLMIFPVLQFFFYHEDEKNCFHNPYLPPFFIYMPFNTRTIPGYIFAYLIISVGAITLYSVTLAAFAIYIHVTVKLRGHFQILNYSLNNIHKRAYLKYKRIQNLQEYDSSEELFEKEDFQACLNSCLTANIKHHHALMKFREMFQPFVGAFLLDVCITISVIYAALFYLIVQKLPITYFVTFIETFLSEQSALFLMCYLGETVSGESGKVFESLYGIPWTNCNMKLNRSIKIMMSNTLQPFKVKALLLDTTASLTSYCHFMMTVYKIMNLFHRYET